MTKPKKPKAPRAYAPVIVPCKWCYTNLTFAEIESLGDRCTEHKDYDPEWARRG